MENSEKPMATLDKTHNITKSANSSDIHLDPDDSGHRFGNFHSYYQFNPPSNRLDVLKELGIFKYLAEHCSRKRRRVEASSLSCSNTKENTIVYSDVGCNEGDLTIDIARALHETLSKPIEFVGVDIDPVLISRASQKWQNNQQQNDKITGKFQVGKAQDLSISECGADIMSLFSTTMWIHIHGGDQGLKEALERICYCTRQFLIIEPQPSKCYRNAMVRLRKMGRNEIDASSERLKLRPNIENEIEKILNDNGFHRVALDHSQEHDSKRTKWNRALQLYERKPDKDERHILSGVPER